MASFNEFKKNLQDAVTKGFVKANNMLGNPRFGFNSFGKTIGRGAKAIGKGYWQTAGNIQEKVLGTKSNVLTGVITAGLVLETVSAIGSAIDKINNATKSMRISTFERFGRTVESLNVEMSKIKTSAQLWAEIPVIGRHWRDQAQAANERSNFNRGLPQRVEFFQYLQQRASAGNSMINQLSPTLVGRSIAARPGMTPGYFAYQKAEIERRIGPEKYIKERKQTMDVLKKQMDKLAGDIKEKSSNLRGGVYPYLTVPYQREKLDEMRQKLDTLTDSYYNLREDPQLGSMKKLNNMMKKLAVDEYRAGVYNNYRVTTGRPEAFGVATAGVGKPQSDPQLRQLIIISELLSELVKSQEGELNQATVLQ